MLRTNITLAATLLLCFCWSKPALGETITKEEVFIKRGPVPVVESTLVVSTALAHPDFNKRLCQLDRWVDMGLSKGWLTYNEASMFKNDNYRLSAFLAAHALPDGSLSTMDGAHLEKQINCLSASISSQMASNQIAGTGALQ